VKAFAILLDTRPGYLEGAGGSMSLLLAPLGPATVLRYLRERLASVGHPRLTIAADFEPKPDYERRIEDSGARVDAIVPARELAARIADYEPSDWLVIVDPRCVPLTGLEPSVLVLENDGRGLHPQLGAASSSSRSWMSRSIRDLHREPSSGARLLSSPITTATSSRGEHRRLPHESS
jgi:hypothetical protein